MARNRIVLFIAFIVLSVIFYYSIENGEESDEAYAAKIELKRKENHSFFRNSEESPLSSEEKKLFKGLQYYPADKKYRVTAKLTPVKANKMLIVPTSNGEDRKYIKHSFAEFELDGQWHKLLLLQNFDKKDGMELFLAFADATNGEETYGGGRYLDLALFKPGAKQVTLDFNLAYNPYCVFNYDYSCPLPPQENLLDIPIHAGEQNYIPAKGHSKSN